MPGVQFGQNIDMNGLRITELAPGVAGTDGVNVDQLTASAPQGFAQDVGDGAALTYNVVHSFGTMDVIVQVYELATDHNVMVDVHRVDANTVQVGFGAAPALNSHRVLVVPVP